MWKINNSLKSSYIPRVQSSNYQYFKKRFLQFIWIPTLQLSNVSHIVKSLLVYGYPSFSFLFFFNFMLFYWLHHTESYFPDLYLELWPLQWRLRVLTTGPQGSPHHLLFSFQLISFRNWALGHVIYHCLRHLTFFSILCFLRNALLGLIHLYPVQFFF